METKSRYEVISDLESKKRELIQERDGLGDGLLEKQKELKSLLRQQSDNIMVMERQVEDKEEVIRNFENTMAERKETITELIKSVEDSLNRFGKINKEK